MSIVISDNNKYRINTLINQTEVKLAQLPMPVILRILSTLSGIDVDSLRQASQFTARVISKHPQDCSLDNLQTEHQIYLGWLFEILKTNDDQLSPEAFFLKKNFRITDPALLFEGAKIAAAKGGGYISRQIKEFGIEDQCMLFEIAKIAAQNPCGRISNYIQNYGITDQNRLFEIAKIAAAHDAFDLSQNIKNYGITDQNKLFEIAKIAAAKNGLAVSKQIQNFGITDSKLRFEIAKIAANEKYLVEEFIKSLPNFELTEQWMLLEIAKILASLLERHSYSTHSFFEFIIQSRFTDQKQLVEIVKIASARNPEATCSQMQRLGIIDENDRVEIAEIVAAHDPKVLGQYIENFEIRDENQLFKIAKIAAAVNAAALSDSIKNFGIRDKDKLFELAKFASAQDGCSYGQGIYHYLGNYQISDPDKIFELCKISVLREGAIGFENTRKLFGKSTQDNQKRQTLALLVFNRRVNEDRSVPSSISREFVTPLSQKLWQSFTQIRHLTIPAEFETKEEQREVQQQLQEIFNHWKAAAKECGISDKVITSLENAIFKERTNLEQQRKDICWLFALPLIPESPLCDEALTPILLSISKITDFSMRQTATDALIHANINPQKKEMLKALIEGRKEHLHLVVLLSLISGFSKETTLELLDELSPNVYQDSKIIGSINEMLLALKKSYLSIEKKQELIKLIFNTPTPGPREPKPQYTARLALHRQNQYHWRTVLHSMLNFEQDDLLKDVKDTAELVKKWETFIGEAFGVSPDLLPRFISLFSQSKRYPDGLIIYGTRLQSLPEAEKALVRPLLGKIATTVLSGDFPKARYDLAENNHLKTVFADNPSLLKAWQTPLIVQIDRKGVKTEKTKTPQQLVQRLTKQALSDSHLGKDQKSKYPELDSILAGSTSLIEIPPGDVEEQKRVQIVNRCAELLNPQSDLSEIKKSLDALLELVPADVQFHRDVRDILNQLSASQVLPEGWTIEDTDAWEDLELMGTEVQNSCQNIKGQPQYNKCLIAAILDGKIRLMIGRDTSGKIIGRAILRVLWDEEKKKPVLFVDRLYTRGRDHETLQHDILEGCRQKAEAMGLTLTASSRDYPHLSTEEYPGTLKSLGGPAPYEYVDALSGIQENGLYSIPDSRVLWSPPILEK